MCAIFGIGFQRGSKMDSPGTIQFMLSVLMRKAQVRGHDATGISIVTPKKIIVVKKNIPAEDFSRCKEYESTIAKYLKLSEKDGPDRVWSIIGHCRAQTKGTHENNDNNHPIVTDSVVGVHNGVINNDDSIFNAYSRKGMKRRAQVDSEAIFRVLQYYIDKDNRNNRKAILKAFKVLKGSYACAFTNMHTPYSMWLFRAYGPTDLLHFKKYGMVAFASSAAFIKDATKAVDFGPCTEISYPQNTGVGINLFLNRIHSFKLEVPTVTEPAVAAAMRKTVAM